MKNGFACRLLGQEALDIVGANLIGPLRDRGADDRHHALALCAELVPWTRPWPRRCRRSAPRQPAWAAAMTRASGSQNRTGAQSAVSAPMASPGVRVTRASASDGSAIPGLVDDHRRRAVDLVERQQPVGRDAQGLGDQGAVLPHSLRVVAGAETAIERAVNALRNAALAGEESVADAVTALKGRGAKHGPVGCHHGRFGQDTVKCCGPKGGGGGRSALVSASALNNIPICLGSTSRDAPEAIASACAGRGALKQTIAARAKAELEQELALRHRAVGLQSERARLRA